MALLVRSAACRCGRSARSKCSPASTCGRRGRRMEVRTPACTPATTAGHCGACVVLGGLGPASISASAESRLSLILLSTHGSILPLGLKSRDTLL